MEDFAIIRSEETVLLSHGQDPFNFVRINMVFVFFHLDELFKLIGAIQEIFIRFFGRKVEVTKDHVLRRNDEGFTITRRKDVVGSKHQFDCFFLSCFS